MSSILQGQEKSELFLAIIVSRPEDALDSAQGWKNVPKGKEKGAVGKKNILSFQGVDLPRSTETEVILSRAKTQI